MLAGVLDRDGQQLSASQTRQQALADADHLAILHAIWTAETTPAREQHYRDLLLAQPAAASTGASPATRPGGCGGPCAPPNWPAWTPREVLAAAIGERDLAGARDLAAVIDARLRYRTRRPGPGSRPARGRPRSPPSPTPNAAPTLTEIAALMDARKDRIGEHAAEHAPPWAVTALGPVPAHPLDRLDWQQRAASIGAWRELSGYDHPADPIGPEPVAAAPDLRAAWHEAFAALGPADGPDVRGMPDGRLLHLRDTYPIETAWAPQ